MEKQIYVQRINGKNSPAVPATLSYAQHGPGCLITIRSTDGLAIRLAGTHRALLAALEPMLEAMRRALPTSDPARIGIIRAEAAEPDPAEQPKPFSRGRKPQAHQLTGDPAHDWPLWVARFNDSPELMSVMAEFFKTYYRVDPNKLQSEAEPGLLDTMIGYVKNKMHPPDTLAADLAAVLASGDEAGLFKPDGTANQSEIARRLNVANAGGYRARILAVAEALEVHGASTTTTNARPGQDEAQIRGSGRSEAA